MDRRPARASALREPFASTANALTALYKTAVAAERDARAAGERAAYLAMLEWAARRSRAGLSVGAADLAQFASERLAVGAPLAEGGVGGVGVGGGGGGAGGGLVGGSVGDEVARSIGELRVRPKKRARADIGDAFLQILREGGDLSGEESDGIGAGGEGGVVGAADVITADAEVAATRKVAAKRAQGGLRGSRRRDGDGH